MAADEGDFAFLVIAHVCAIVARLDLASPGQGSSQGNFVGVFDVATNRHAKREPGNPNVLLFQKPCQIERRGLALDIWVGGHDHLLDTVESLEQRGYCKLFGADTSLRRKRAHQDMITASKLAGSLDWLDIVRLFDDANLGAISLRVSTETARLDIGDRITDRAVEEFFFDLQYGSREGFCFRRWSLENVVGETGGGFGADAREARELAEQIGLPVPALPFLRLLWI